ncbi:Uncharacterised protein [uncultured Blautia sp.]|nr:Uncharacterised protein [uncultured Blautia sp.]
MYVSSASFHTNVLIETLWNVKLDHATRSIKLATRINRNIVECKAATFSVSRVDLFRINRNIVECKVFPVNDTVFFAVVLIETLWNVKISQKKAETVLYKVLIETLWNVKRL